MTENERNQLCKAIGATLNDDIITLRITKQFHVPLSTEFTAKELLFCIGEEAKRDIGMAVELWKLALDESGNAEASL
jgi:hypothetical protein